MLARYQYADAYTLEELRRAYTGSDWRGRIRILRRHLRRGDLPNEIAQTALRDDHVEVRQWWARYAPLSDHGREEMLNDPDPLVRASVWENPHCLPYKNLVVDWESAFRACTHMERLALMCNSKVPQELIERVFDPPDTQLAIELAERHQLALAVLTNEDLFRKMEQDADEPYDYGSASRFLQRLWKLASTWPDHAAVRYVTYRHVPVYDQTKAQCYAKSPSGLRGAILENCGPRDRQTLELGMADSDTLRRSQAYATVNYLTEEQLNALVSGNDYMSLDRACCNRSLPAEDRQKTLKRLRELGHNNEPWLDEAEREIEAAIEQQNAESETNEDHGSRGGRADSSGG